MALLGVLIGEVLDAFQADETTAHTVNQQRSEAAREADHAEWADRQTFNLHEWLSNPDEVDFTTEDTPGFHSGIYDPTEEFTDG